jgi:hypothetical protein
MERLESVSERIESMSRLLYAESASSFRSRKYGNSILFLTVALMMIFISVFASFQIAATPSGEAWEKIAGIVFSVVFISFICYLMFAALVIPGLYATRFEIFDDKIILPFRRDRKRGLLGSRTRDTIKKDDVKKAQIDVLAEDGPYEVKIRWMQNTGRRGEWRCMFLLTSGELFVLESSWLPCGEECVPALAEFIKGLEDDMSTFFL